MRASLSPARRVVLAVGLVPVVAACVWGAVLVTSIVQGSRDYQYSAVHAATALEVQASNAALTLEPSADGQVHVEARGHYAGRRPTVGLTSRDGHLTITASCRSTWLHSCNLHLDVALPAQLPVVARGDNGAIQAHGLTGALRLRTDNGTVAVTGARGVLQLQSSNGAISTTATTSSSVSARTDNGQIGLDFAAAPTTVDAQTSNGQVEIALPTSATYYITTGTSNGSIETTVPSDRFAHRTITARTDNGGIDIRPS